jgi:hypothetical protein
LAADGGDAKGEKMTNLGTVLVGEYKGQVLFQYPEDDGKSYRVDVAISKPNNTAAINSGRIEVWLLARGSKAVAVKERPRPGSLIEVNSAGTTASATYLFSREVERKDLVGIVVAVDGEPTTLKIPSAGTNGK